MNLKELIINERNIKREVMIGREVQVLDEMALLVGLQEVSLYDEDDQLHTVCKMMLLREGVLEDEWDDDFAAGEFEDDWDEEENVSRRHVLASMIHDKSETDMIDAVAVAVGGEVFGIEEAEEGWLMDRPHDAVQFLKRAEDAGVIPPGWMLKDAAELWMTEYVVEPEIFSVNWDADILSVNFGFQAVSNEVLVEEVITCPCGRFDEPASLELYAPNGETITVELYGVHMLDIWKDAEVLGLDEEDLELVCCRDERLLAVEFNVNSESDVAVNFYTKSFLDAPDSERGIPAMMMGTANAELRMIDIVPADFDEDVELELFSFEVFED